MSMAHTVEKALGMQWTVPPYMISSSPTPRGIYILGVVPACCVLAVEV